MRFSGGGDGGIYMYVGGSVNGSYETVQGSCIAAIVAFCLPILAIHFVI